MDTSADPTASSDESDLDSDVDFGEPSNFLVISTANLGGIGPPLCARSVSRLGSHRHG